MKGVYYMTIGVIIGMYLVTCTSSVSPSRGTVDVIDTLHWITDGGDIVASLRGSEDAFSKPDPHVHDSIAKVYKAREKDLLEYIIALEQTNAELPAVPGTKAADYFPPEADSCPPQIKNLRESFSSPYYKADVQIGDSSYLHLQAYDTVTVVWKRVRTGGFFNRQHLIQLDISTTNPDTRVYGLKAYRIREKKKKWAIGMQAGYGFHFDGSAVRRSPYVGLGVSKTIIRF